MFPKASYFVEDNWMGSSKNKTICMVKPFFLSNENYPNKEITSWIN